MISLFAKTIIQDHVEASGHRYDELLQRFVSMTRARCSAWYVVEVIDAFDFEGYVSLRFDEGEIAARIGNLWEVNDLTIV